MDEPRYLSPKVTLDGRRVRVSFTLARDPAPSTHNPEPSFLFGSQFFDAETGNWIADGPRVPATAEVVLEFELPGEPGRYRLLVSPLREGEFWYYERGWSFLAIDAEVSEAGARVTAARITTRAGLRRETLAGDFGRALVLPALTVWRNRGLIRAMVRRDVLGRYRGSYGGLFWTVLNPLLLMATYFFVFGMVLRARFGNDPSRAGFALYFLAGMLPWMAFSEAAGRAATVVLEHRNFVRKLVFAIETLPVNLVISGLVTEVFALAAFALGVLVVRGAIPAAVLWLPVLLVPQVLFTAGMCWFLAALGVFVRDLGQAMGFVLTLWFFLTPICYPETSLPAWAVPVLSVNPVYVLVRGYRAVFLEGQAPAFGPLWKLWLVSAAVWVAGHAWFYKLRKTFADIV
jgi:lipopolysaccharide transport system permease protein